MQETPETFGGLGLIEHLATKGATPQYVANRLILEGIGFFLDQGEDPETAKLRITETIDLLIELRKARN